MAGHPRRRRRGELIAKADVAHLARRTVRPLTRRVCCYGRATPQSDCSRCERLDYAPYTEVEIRHGLLTTGGDLVWWRERPRLEQRPRGRWSMLWGTTRSRENANIGPRHASTVCVGAPPQRTSRPRMRWTCVTRSERLRPRPPRRQTSQPLTCCCAVCVWARRSRGSCGATGWLSGARPYRRGLQECSQPGAGASCPATAAAATSLAAVAALPTHTCKRSILGSDSAWEEPLISPNRPYPALEHKKREHCLGAPSSLLPSVLRRPEPS